MPTETDWSDWIAPFFGNPSAELMRRHSRVGPFEFYVRWWHTRVNLADITADGGGRTGQLPTLLDALETELRRLCYTELRAENVVSDWLIVWLERRGFRAGVEPRTLTKELG